MSSPHAPTLSDFRDAAKRIEGYAHRTPVLTCQAIDDMAGRHLYFKCENLQKVGAFKFRGAMNAIARLSESDAARGVVTHSSGNHAQALALAARMRGIPATIVMPTSAPAVKRAAVLGYGALVVDCEPTLEARETTTDAVIAQTGATLVHAYDNHDIIAGQGTTALELLDEVPQLQAVLAPVGGGGLLSGVALAAKALRPDMPVYAAEPIGANDAARSKASGTHVTTHQPHTISDGLLTTLGQRNWPIVRDHVNDIFTVDDAQTIHAMRLIWERMKLVVEPSGAVPLAGVLSERFQTEVDAAHVGVVISGGNLDLDGFFGQIQPRT